MSLFRVTRCLCPMAIWTSVFKTTLKGDKRQQSQTEIAVRVKARFNRSKSPGYLLRVCGTEIGCGPQGHPKKVNHLFTASNTFSQYIPSFVFAAGNVGNPRSDKVLEIMFRSVLLLDRALKLSLSEESEEQRNPPNIREVCKDSY